VASLNKVLLIGNLTRDPELRYIPSGQAVSTLGLAVNRRYKSKAGESKEETTFVSVVVWGRTAENCARYLKKGSPIFVEGRLRIRDYVPKGEENSGRKRYVTEIVADTIQFLSSGNRGEQGGGGAPADYVAPLPEAAPAEAPVDEPYPNLDEEGQ
jgi:single-strand DNA-binding protein